MLTQKNRRFLIIWFSVIIFALLCNIVPITGHLSDISWNKTGKPASTPIYLFSRGYDKDDFWPFNPSIIESEYMTNPTEEARAENESRLYARAHPGLYVSETHLNVETYNVFTFNGIFEGFDYWEFVIYGVVGLAVVFLPNIWNKE